MPIEGTVMVIEDACADIEAAFDAIEDAKADIEAGIDRFEGFSMAFKAASIDAAGSH